MANTATANKNQNQAKEKAITKSQLKTMLAEKAGLSTTQALEALDALAEIALSELHKNKQFVIPGLVKIVVTKKPPTKERQGRNPATGETITIKAKPARTAVKGRILKAVKDAVGA